MGKMPKKLNPHEEDFLSSALEHWVPDRTSSRELFEEWYLENFYLGDSFFYDIVEEQRRLARREKGYTKGQRKYSSFFGEKAIAKKALKKARYCK